MTFHYDRVKNVLACPQTGDALVLHESRLVSVNRETRLSYPVENSIPRLLESEAEQLNVDEWKAIMESHGRLTDQSDNASNSP